MASNVAILEGSLNLNKSGESVSKHYGKIQYGGWFIKVADENGYFMTNLQVRTENPVVAQQVSAAKGGVIKAQGSIRTINVAPSKLHDGEWIREKDDYRIFFFVDAVETVQAPEVPEL